MRSSFSASSQCASMSPQVFGSFDFDLVHEHLPVGLDLPLDLPADPVPHWVTISHLAAFHTRVGLHRLKKCLSSFILDLISLQLQRGERHVRLSDVICDSNSSSVANLVPPEVERLDEIPSR